jgi:hypothetical protein
MTLDYTIRERTVRVSIDATATRPPGRNRTWTVEAGHWRAEGATEKTAADLLANGLREFVLQYRPPAVLALRGYVAVVALDLGTVHAPLVWHERILHPHGRVGSSTGTAESWEEAEAHARHTLAQISTDWHDDASVQEAAAYLEGGQRHDHGQYGPDEFYRYAAWQRAAKAAMDAGRADWHQWAGDHKAEFTVPRPSDDRS